jgi:hypothetical protein
MKTLVVVIATAALLPGCWPARFVERPGVSGTVLSAQTQEPIAGARVALASNVRPGRINVVVTTDSNGRFKILAIHDWKLYSPFGETWPVPGFIEVSAEGFLLQRQPLAWPQTGHSRNNVGPISLVPAR